MLNAIFDAFVQVGIMLALLIVVFIAPAIAQAEWDWYKGKGPLLPPDDSGYDSINDRPIW